MEALFVGGSKDGQRLEVGDTPDYWVVSVPYSLLTTPNMPFDTAMFRQETYIISFLHGEGKECFLFYRHENLSVNAALHKLFVQYQQNVDPIVVLRKAMKEAGKLLREDDFKNHSILQSAELLLTSLMPRAGDSPATPAPTR